jgi:hypothetical protein
MHLAPHIPPRPYAEQWLDGARRLSSEAAAHSRRQFGDRVGSWEAPDLPAVKVEGSPAARLRNCYDSRAAHHFTGSASRASRKRMALHGVVAVLSWVVLAYLIVAELIGDAPADWAQSVQLITIAGICLVLGAWTWVRWNQSVARRIRDRSLPILRDVAFRHDAIGRAVLTSPAARFAPGETTISLNDNGDKHYGTQLPL